MCPAANSNTPRLLIKFPRQLSQVFLLSKSVVKIGRGEEADLILPNLFISRIHAVIEQQDDGYWIRDNDSQNGLRLNKKKSAKHQLFSGDEIQIMDFILVFLENTVEENLYRGRSIIYLPKYDRKKITGSEDETIILPHRDNNVLLRKVELLHNGCIFTDEDRYFYPGHTPLTFGKNAIVPVNGWFVFGIVATIHWEKAQHIFTKKSLFCTATINGKDVSSLPLRIGDRIQIGKSTYEYRLREGS